MLPLRNINNLRRLNPAKAEMYLVRHAHKTVRIYSKEHNAYWRPLASGYTTDIYKAGIYSFYEAFEYTYHCGNEKGIYFEFL